MQTFRLASCAIAALALALSTPAPAAAQKSREKTKSSKSAKSAKSAKEKDVAVSTPKIAAYIVRLGNDTLAVERFRVDNEVITGEEVLRRPVVAMRKYTMNMGSPRSLKSMTFERTALVANQPPSRFELTFGADSLIVRATEGTRDTTFRMAARDAVPFVNFSYAMMQLAAQRAREAASDSTVVSFYNIGARGTNNLIVRRAGPDTLLFVFPGQAPYRAAVDKMGTILGVQGFETTQKVLVERVADADVQAIAAAWTAIERASGAPGALSPTDTVRATVGGGHVTIGYSRPSLRGRKAIGGVLVPYGQIWRTGANAATRLTIDTNIVINGTRIPKGTYTLWTVPQQGSQWMLVVSRKILDDRGAPLWGTMYDAGSDVARIPVGVEPLPAPVETFTIQAAPSADANKGTITMAWENTRVYVPFQVVP